MALTRRALLRSAAAGGAALAGGAGLTGLAGCADFGAGEPSDEMTLWYWAGSLSESVLDDEKKRLARQGLDLVRSAIGGDYRTKFLTTLAGRAAVPDIAGMNSDVATYFPDADQFVDLRTLGAGKLADQYLTWKWKQGVTPDGRMIAFPMDTGPTALYYRTDLLAQAGLPSEPGEVAASIKTWDDWLAAGRTLKAKIPHCTPVDSLAYLFRMVLSSATSRYMDENNKYIGDRGPTRYAWEIAAKAAKDGLSAAAQFLATDWYALASAGRLPWFSGAVWVLNYLGPGAPKTKGKWRLATAPGGPGNDGGSFLAISKYCQHPEQAYAAITWMQSARNQVRAFHDVNLFPSAPAAFTDPALHKPNAFFGGQRTIEVFAKAATKVPICYLSPYDSIINTIFQDELGKVESQGKNADQAWKDVQDQVARELEHRGVSS
jgi:cellobiose transport system substrate-binding protein